MTTELKPSDWVARFEQQLKEQGTSSNAHRSTDVLTAHHVLKLAKEALNTRTTDKATGTITNSNLFKAVEVCAESENESVTVSEWMAIEEEYYKLKDADHFCKYDTCGIEYDKRKLDELVFHNTGHQPVIATGIIGTPVTGHTDKAIEECAEEIFPNFKSVSSNTGTKINQIKQILTRHFGPSTRKEGDEPCRTKSESHISPAPKADQQQVGASPSRSAEDFYALLNNPALTYEGRLQVIRDFQSSSHLAGRIEQSREDASFCQKMADKQPSFVAVQDLIAFSKIFENRAIELENIKQF